MVNNNAIYNGGGESDKTKERTKSKRYQIMQFEDMIAIKTSLKRQIRNESG